MIPRFIPEENPELVVSAIDERVIEWYGLLRPSFIAGKNYPIVYTVTVEIKRKIKAEYRNLKSLPPHGFYGYIVPRLQGVPVMEKLKIEFRKQSFQFFLPEAYSMHYQWCFFTHLVDAIKQSSEAEIELDVKLPIALGFGFDELSIHLGEPYQAAIKGVAYSFDKECELDGDDDKKPRSEKPLPRDDSGSDEGDLEDDLPNSPAYDGDDDDGESYNPTPSTPSEGYICVLWEGSRNGTPDPSCGRRDTWLCYAGTEGEEPSLEVSGTTTRLLLGSRTVDYAFAVVCQDIVITDWIFSPTNLTDQPV